MAKFTLTVDTRTPSMGETPEQERGAIMEILRAAAHRIGTGHKPIPIKDRDGIECANYEFGDGMLNHDLEHEHPHL